MDDLVMEDVYGYSLSLIKADGNLAQYKIQRCDSSQEKRENQGASPDAYHPSSVFKFARDIREVLLVSVRGVAISHYSLKMTVGDEKPTVLKHKYSGIPHLMENAFDLARNLGKVAIRSKGLDLPESGLEARAEFVVEGEEKLLEITGGDLSESLNSAGKPFGTMLEIVNPKKYIATLVRPEDGSAVVMSLSLVVSRDSGPSLDAGSGDGKECLIPTEARGRSVMRCGIVPYGEDGVLMEIETNGSRTPDEALREAVDDLEKSPWDFLEKPKRVDTQVPEG